VPWSPTTASPKREPGRAEWTMRYDVVRVSDLPIPNEMRGPTCMLGPGVWLRRRAQRRVAWLRRPLRPRDCCWHHQVNWPVAAEAAVRLVRRAHCAGLHDGDEIEAYILERLAGEALGELECDGLLALVGAGAGIELNDDPDPQWRYVEGQHRVAAQLDQGVRETVVQRLEQLDPGPLPED
jgi:hypothetical protein